jgi:hypothetical protein
MEDLIIVKQESLAKEKFSKNEVQKEVHVVAKNLPFTIEVASNTISFTQNKTSAKLYYDCDNLDFKPVDLIKSDPMQYRVFIDPSGHKVTIEFRVSVLTSQHEDSLFRIKIAVAVNEVPVEVFSEAIRVVSKPSQVVKQKRGRAPINKTIKTEPVSPSSSPCIGAPVASPPTSGNKRAANGDILSETLLKMAQEQQEQRKLLEQLLNAPPSKKIHYEEDIEDDDFETALQRFISSYSRVKYEDRPQKLRKVISMMNISETECLSDFIIQSNQQVEDRQTIQESVGIPSSLSLSGLLNLDDSDKSSDWDSFDMALSPESDI